MISIFSFANNESSKKADELARSRGYADYCSIDDPVLREWIWNHVMVEVNEKPKLKMFLCFYIFSLISSLLFGFLLGLLF